MILPAAMQAMQALHAAAGGAGALPAATLALVHLRASQINGCSVCAVMHAKELARTDASAAKLATVAAWRDAPYFTAAERAALRLTEAVTRLSDREDPVPDDVWAEATAHYDERALSALLLEIAAINVWNRLNVPTRMVAGDLPTS